MRAPLVSVFVLVSACGGGSAEAPKTTPSSPKSGAWHFARDAAGDWVSTRGTERLLPLLEAELGLPKTGA